MGIQSQTFEKECKMTNWHEDFGDEPALIEIANRFVFDDEHEVDLRQVVQDQLNQQDLDEEFEDFVDLVFG
jgi:TFIIF-interacting CTD phosphatase-like protein